MAQKHEVVISGISGQFPECDGVTDLTQLLMNKVNLVTVDDTKWTPGELNVPSGLGKMKNSNAFDQTFFGIHRKLCDIMDPHIRLCMERSFEAICDAGVNPAELSGTDTASIMASMISETEYGSVMVSTSSGHGMLGHSRTMQANRVSYVFNLKGPSFVIDSSWTGGMQGLNLAHKLIADGEISAALVGVCSLIFRPEVSYHFDGMGRITFDNKTKSFCDDADGYNRSEACVIFFLQRAEDARRSYGTVLGAMASLYGSRNCGFADNNPQHYSHLLKDLYQRTGVNPSSISYVELDGCGAKRLDAMELNAIDEIFCKSRKEPLLVGSIKSNLGHTEASSSLVSAVKAIIALDSGVIPPNIHYSKPNSLSSGLIEGRLKVVTEATPLPGDTVGVSSIGICGSYGHLILKRNPKVKARVPIRGELPPDGIPRLVIMSGREEGGLRESFKKVESMPIDEEFIALTHQLFGREVQRHLVRGYSLLGSGSTVDHQIQGHSGGTRRPVWFTFSGMGSQWPGMGVELMKLPIFAQAIHKCQRVLLPEGVDVIDIITNPDPSIFDTILHSFVGIAAVQIGLVDVLKALGIEPDGIVGHSVGELGCAYADGCFTAEQMILSAYARGKASVEANLIKGMMAAVGMGYKQIKNELPPTIEVACHNSADSCTLSGPEKDMEVYIEDLKKRGVFAKLVNVANIAYHSKHIAPAAPALLRYLKEVIPAPKARSSRWISSSVPESDWGSDLAKLSSAEYHTNNLLSSVLFEEASAHIPKNAITIEIAPHGLLQAILRRSLSTCTNIGLTNRSQKDGLRFLLNSIGRLYLEGLDLDVAKLYPKVEFPVSRGTPSIHDLISWSQRDDTPENMTVSVFKAVPSFQFISIGLSEEQCEIYAQHKINDRIILPSSTLLQTIMDMFSTFRNDKMFTRPLMIQNISFLEDVEIKSKSYTEFYFQLQKGSGEFEVCIDKTIVATGKIVGVINVSKKFINEANIKESGILLPFDQEDIYNYLEQMGIEHGEAFKNIKAMTVYKTGIFAKVLWKGNWMLFLDSLFKILSVYYTSKSNKLQLVKKVREILIDPSKFGPDHKELDVTFDFTIGMLSCKGLQILEILTRDTIIDHFGGLEIKYEKQEFIPFNNPKIKDFQELMTVYTQLFLENCSAKNDGSSKKIILIEIKNGKRNNTVTETIEKILLHQSDIQVEVISYSEDDILDDSEWKELNKECCLIISENKIKKLAITLLNIFNKGFLLTTLGSEYVSPSEINAVTVMEKEMDGTTFLLLRKITSLVGVKHTVQISNENWETELHLKLKGVSEKGESSVVYVISEENSRSIIHDTINVCNDIPNSELVRFIFLDNDSPKFTLGNVFYGNQLQKDLKINICKGGEWGSYRLLPLHCQNTKAQPINNRVVHLNTLEIENMTIKCLGLNFPDLTNATGKVDSKFGVLEYSGINKNKRGEMGICSLSEKNTLIQDSILTWSKPQHWTYEQAASVPISYSIAYYALTFAKVPVQGEFVLVHDGCLPVSQAVIRVAISMGCKVLTTCRSEAEKIELKKMLPQIDDKAIFSCSSIDFDIDVLAATNGNGVNFIINTLGSKAMLDISLTCLAIKGSIYQISMPVMESNEKLGLLVFLKEAHFHGLTAETLLRLSSEKKTKLQLAIKDGLNKGIIQPLSVIKVSTPLTSIEAFVKLKSPEIKNKKLILSIDSRREVTSPNYYLCSRNNSYLIIGSYNGLWMKLLEWLIVRGASTIFIILHKKYMTSYANHRFNCLIKQYPTVNVHILPLTRIESESSAKKLLSDINAKYILGATFVLEMEQKEKLSMINEILQVISPKCDLICFGIGGRICEERRKLGLPGLALLWRTNITKVANIFYNLDNLICRPDPTNAVIVLTEYNMDSGTVSEAGKLSSLKLNYLPANSRELEELGYEVSCKPHFEEIPTLSPRFSGVREILPVFFIPGLKPNQFNKLASKLLYPAFKAELPEKFNSFEEVAHELVQSLEDFNLNAFTIVASDWGGALGLTIAHLLENKGKTVVLILLDGAPKTNQDWANLIMDNDWNKLLNKYFIIPAEKKREFVLSSDWNMKLDMAIKHGDLDTEINIKYLKKGLNAIKNRLTVLSGFQFVGRLGCRVHLIRRDGCLESDDCMLQPYLKQSLKIQVTDDATHKSLLRNSKVIQTINNLVLIEYKDMALQDTDKRVRATNILIDAKYNSPQLVRV